MSPDDAQIPTDQQPLEARDLSAVTFHMARRSGYEVLDVDSFIDQAQSALSGSPAERADFRSAIAGARFRMARRAGYEMEEVDAFLDRLSATFAAQADPEADAGNSTEVGTEPRAETSPRPEAEVQELRGVARQPRGARFDTSKGLFSGYQMPFVDSLVEEVATALGRDDPGPLNLDPTGFPTSRPGYRKGEVRDWLERVSDLLQRD